MPQSITVDIIDRIEPKLVPILTERAKSLPDMRYCDLRISVRKEKGAVAENGKSKGQRRRLHLRSGRASDWPAHGKSAAGYLGRILGSADAGNIENIVWESIRQAHQRARASARFQKISAVKKFSVLGESITGTELAPVAIAQAIYPATFYNRPQERTAARHFGYGGGRL